MIIIPIKWLFHWEYTLFSDKPIWVSKNSHAFQKLVTLIGNLFMVIDRWISR